MHVVAGRAHPTGPMGLALPGDEDHQVEDTHLIQANGILDTSHFSGPGVQSRRSITAPSQWPQEAR
jgi:hypothetical protein